MTDQIKTDFVGKQTLDRLDLDREEDKMGAISEWQKHEHNAGMEMTD